MNYCLKIILIGLSSFILQHTIAQNPVVKQRIFYRVAILVIVFIR